MMSGLTKKNHTERRTKLEQEINSIHKRKTPSKVILNNLIYHELKTENYEFMNVRGSDRAIKCQYLRVKKSNISLVIQDNESSHVFMKQVDQ